MKWKKNVYKESVIKNESSKMSHIHAHETQPLKRKMENNSLVLYTPVHVKSKNVLWFY